MSSHTLLFHNGLPAPAHALQVIFAMRHGTLSVAWFQPSTPQLLLEARTLQAYFDPPIPPGSSVSIRLDSSGEEATIVVSEFLADSPSDWMTAKADVSLLAFSRKETDTKVIFAWRAAQAKKGLAPLHMAFFNEFERRTLSLDKGDKLQKKLKRMLMARQEGDAEALKMHRDSITKAELAPISRALFDSQPAAGLPLGLSSLEEAFDRFSRGELSLLDGNETPQDLEEYKGGACQPNSTLHLLFAELAEACVARGVEDKLWGDLLPTLVYSQTTFFDAYGDGSLEPIPHGVGLKRRMAPATLVPEKMLEKVRGDFWKKHELQAVWTANAQSYVRF